MLLVDPASRADVAAEVKVRGPSISAGEWVLLGIGTLAALAIRLVGIRGGLPYPSNIDEVLNYVWRIPGLEDRSFDPVALSNPTAFTYLSWAVASLWQDIPKDAEALGLNPGPIILSARLVSSVAGAALVPAVWAATRVAFGRLAALVVIPLAAFAFLPVVYSHMSVNDAMATTVLAIALACCLVAMRRQGAGWFLAAGAAVGLAAATKYNAVLAIGGLAGAALVVGRDRGARYSAGLLAAGVPASVLAFAVANPYSVIEAQHFSASLGALRSATARGWPGGTHSSPFAFYPWSLGWGLGWAALAAAAVGLAFGVLKRKRSTLVLAMPLVLVAISCLSSDTFFGRYALPAYPALMVFAAGGASAAIRWVAGLRGGLLAPAAVVAAVALCADGLVHSLHFDRLWLREGTIPIAAKWVERHVPAGSNLIVDRYVPPWWPTGRSSGRYRVWPATWSGIRERLPDGRVSVIVGVRGRGGLAAGSASIRLLDFAERNRWCWIVTSSFQAGRAFNDPQRFREALRYYSALESPRARLMFRISPFADTGGRNPQVGARPFDFDWSYDSYPLDFVRSGPLLSIYWLNACGRPPSAAG